MIKLTHKQAKAMGITLPEEGGGFLQRLMDRPKVPWALRGKKLILGPETVLSIAVADSCRSWTLSGRLRGIWFKVPNEGKRGWLSAILMRACGLIPGVFDFVFMGAWGCLGIELKSGSNSLSEPQQDFRKWCVQENIPYYTARTIGKVEEILVSHKALAPVS